MELAVHKAFREVLIEVLSFGFRVAVLVLAHLLAVHTVIYGTQNKHTIKKKK